MPQQGAGERPVIVIVNHRFVKGKGEQEETVRATEEVPAVLKFETTPAVVTRGYGLTINRGNFESARVDVSVSVPCYVEDIEAADHWAAAFCEERIKQEVASVRGGPAPKAPKPGAF